MRIGIFGSCVTRDLFEDPALRPTLAQYTSRSSVISVVADPVPLDAELVRLDSAFQRRCVIEDFSKAFWEQLPEAKLDWLVIDLIDERFEVLQTPSSWVTRSSAYESAGLDDADGFDFEPVRRLTGQAAGLFTSASRVFAERVTEVLPAERVIVHRAWWMTRYRDGEALHDFPDDRAEFADRHNDALTNCYDRLAASFAGRAQEVDLGRGRYRADARHRWDLEPFHYEAAYNEAALARLREITGA
jgi:hypothetical protein